MPQMPPYGEAKAEQPGFQGPGGFAPYGGQNPPPNYGGGGYHPGYGPQPIVTQPGAPGGHPGMMPQGQPMGPPGKLLIPFLISLN